MNEYIPSQQVIAWAKAHGWNAEAHVEYFNNYVANMTRKPYKDPERAFRNAVISDWGNVRFKMTKDGTYWPKKVETRERPINGMVWDTNTKGWVKA